MTGITEAQSWLKRYREAIAHKDKQKIIALDDEHANSSIQWDRLPDALGNELDELTEKSNDIIYS